VHDANLEDVAFPAGGHVLPDEFPRLAGMKCVEVQGAVDGELHRVVVLGLAVFRVAHDEFSHR